MVSVCQFRGICANAPILAAPRSPTNGLGILRKTAIQRKDPPSKTRCIFVDFENVQPKDLALLNGQDYRVMVFIGATQAKLPTEFAMAVQGLGTAAESVKIEGSGRNTLDLHIAYYLGSTSATGSSDESFVIRKEWQTRFQFGRQGARLFFADEILDFEVIWTARPKTNFNVSVEPVIGRPVKRVEFSCGQGVDYGFFFNRNTSL